MTRLKLLVAYRGDQFHGFAEQVGEVPTVARALRTALEQKFREPLRLTCAGRTDTGVHAYGQVVTFDVQDGAEVEDAQRLLSSLNKRLGPHIAVRSVETVADEFDARHSATGRRYRYSVLNTPTPNPLIADTAWWVPAELDIEAMNRASADAVGEQDFSTFCRRPEPEATLVRNVRSAQWLQLDDGLLRFDVEANAFCHQMVRSLVGHLVAIGQGKLPANAMRTAIDARDRAKGATLAPPQGLCLWEVLY